MHKLLTTYTLSLGWNRDHLATTKSTRIEAIVLFLAIPLQAAQKETKQTT